MNKYCNKCKVEVDSSLHNCPLCGNFLTGEENTEPISSNTIVYAYPIVNKAIYLKQIAFKVMIFATIVALLACTAVDLLVSGKLDWAYHVYVAIAGYWLTVGRSMFFNMEIHRQIMWDILAAIGICFYIEAITHTTQYHWALYWVTPGVIALGMFSLGCTAFYDTKKWGSSIVTLALLGLLSWIPMFVSWLVLKDVHWMLFAVTGLGILVVAGILIFGRKRFVNELKKRFHI